MSRRWISRESFGLAHGDRSAFSSPGEPLAREQWAGAVDVVGGEILGNVCAGMKYRGLVAACGLAGGTEPPSTVAP